MDQIKIGKFIAECRKEKKLTQAQLAEKLCITDKAISKWERGVTMPDSSIMLDLCEIFGINVNELLRGERINEDEERKKTEELLLEMTKKEELQRKRLFKLSLVLFIFWTVLCLIFAVVVVAFFDGNLVLMLVGLSLMYIGGALILTEAKLQAGHYICQNCHHEFEASESIAFHTIIGKPKNWKYHLKCPKCNRKAWAKRILPK